MMEFSRCASSENCFCQSLEKSEDVVVHNGVMKWFCMMLNVCFLILEFNPHGTSENALGTLSGQGDDTFSKWFRR